MFNISVSYFSSPPLTPDGTFPESVEFIQHIHQVNKPLEEIGKAVVC